MLLRKGRFVERRRVAYRLVGVSAAQERIPLEELYADAQEAQSAVADAAVKLGQAQQVALERGETAPVAADPNDDPLGCRWEIIKRWGPDVLTRIRRQRFSSAFDRPLALSPSSPPPTLPSPLAHAECESVPDVLESVECERICDAQTAAVETAAGAAAAKAADADEDQALRADAPAESMAQPPSVEIDSGEPCESRSICRTASTDFQVAAEPRQTVQLDEPAVHDSLARGCAGGAPPADAAVVCSSQLKDSVATVTEREDELNSAQPVTVARHFQSTDSRTPEPALPPPAVTTVPVIEQLPEAPEPRRPGEAANLRRRRFRGAVLRTTVIVLLLVAGVVVFETCSNPFGWIVGGSEGNEIRSLPFVNQSEPVRGEQAAAGAKPARSGKRN